jgi:Zn-dependent membrane protease YugP
MPILMAYWWLMIPGMILAIYAQFKVMSTYRHYLREPVSTGITGAEAARAILDQSGLREVPVEEVPGTLSDHYDPTSRTLRLSPENFHGASVSAVGVAAHEAGHALQHQASYAPMNLRMALVPVTNFASSAAFFIFLLGAFIHMAKLAVLGVLIFGIITLFQLVTLPVEFDASRRAKACLASMGLVRPDQMDGVSRVLGAAALTYVAAMVQSLLQLLQFFLIARGDDRD